jgi:hypothetical protein
MQVDATLRIVSCWTVEGAGSRDVPANATVVLKISLGIAIAVMAVHLVVYETGLQQVGLWQWLTFADASTVVDAPFAPVLSELDVFVPEPGAGSETLAT